MSIYTKHGDHGSTTLASGQPVAKASAIMAALGALDVANAQVAKCRALADHDMQPLLATILQQLATCNTVVAGFQNGAGCPIVPEMVTNLEQNIDHFAQLAPLPNYLIIPGGTTLALELNLARALVRQAELTLWRVPETEMALPQILLCYINRLSDLLFVLANYANNVAGIIPERWKL